MGKELDLKMKLRRLFPLATSVSVPTAAAVVVVAPVEIKSVIKEAIY